MGNQADYFRQKAAALKANRRALMTNARVARELCAPDALQRCLDTARVFSDMRRQALKDLRRALA